MAINVQYGCGLSAPQGWLNFDASPTLRMQQIPVLGRLVKKVDFPRSVMYGDIIKGLPGITPGSCDAVYCSHVLEHLSLQDFRAAISQTYRMMRPGAIFRCVLPDMEVMIENYIGNRRTNAANASMELMRSSLLGQEERPHGFREKLMASLGNSHHLWMWDQYSLRAELEKAGFSNTRKAGFNDSANADFKQVEEEGRFREAICFEAIK